MKKVYFLLIAIGLGALCSCTVKEEDFWTKAKDTPVLHKLTITASMSDKTRTTVQDGGETVLWDAEEQIMVFYDGRSAAFSSQNEETVDITDFVGDMEYADGDKLIALYPYREDAEYRNDTLITSLPSLQVGRAGSFSKNMNLAVAESDSPLMSFKNVGGGIRFTVRRNDITWVSIESIGEEPLAGRVRIVMENGLPVVKEVVDGTPKTALYAPDGKPFIPGRWYYVVMLPGTVQRGVKLVFHTEDGLLGETVSEKALTIDRSMYLGKEELDTTVSSWHYDESGELETEVRSILVEIPQDADLDYVRTLKVVNCYGEYPLGSESTLAPAPASGGKKRVGFTPGFSFRSQFKFVAEGFIVQFLQDLEEQMVMCSISNPEEEFEIMSAESTAIGILMMNPELISDDPYELEATVRELREVDEFREFVDEVSERIEKALAAGVPPDYSDLDTTPVTFAILKHTRLDAVLSQQGLDVFSTRHKEDSLFYKIRNNYRRVIHSYAEREWRTSTGIGHTKTEDVTFTLSEILNMMVGTGGDKKNPQLAEIRVFGQEYQDILSIIHSFDQDESFNYPFPFFLVPESASYWKIVKGSWHWWDRDVKMVFENTSEEIGADLKDADVLNVYTYGMGSLDDGYLENASPQEQFRIIAVYLHGAVNDFIIPLVNLVTGAKQMSKAANYKDFRYDLRFGARKYPEWALVLKLYKNLDKRKAIQKIIAAKNEGKVLEAVEFFVKYAFKQIVTNSDNADKRTYYNLLYNIWKKYSGIKATEREFRDMLKKAWNTGSRIFNGIEVYSATKKISEAAVDIGGAVIAYNSSETINKFPLYKDENPYVKPIFPVMGAAVEGSSVDFAWDMNLGQVVALHGVEYDLTLYITTGVASTVKTIPNIRNPYYTLDLASLQVSDPNPTIQYKIHAHHAGSDGMSIAYSDKISILVTEWQPRLSAVDLGLTVKWSSSNIGASSITDKGKYFAWGEKFSRSDFTWNNYTLRNVDGSMSRYNASDQQRMLLPEDDVVHILQGENWRMPTITEWKELERDCDWYVIKEGDVVVAYSGVSKKNGNILYLPVGGYKKSSAVLSPAIPRYWSSSLTEGGDYNKARSLNEGQYAEFSKMYHGDDRYLGMLVRGVNGESQPPQQETAGAVDLGLSVQWASSNVGASSASDPGSYFAWGETRSKNEYNWATYSFGKAGTNDGMTRYNDIDGTQVLLPGDDAAHLAHKGNWRMPTMAEWEELRNKCDWYEDKQDNVLRGYSIVSKVNGKKIYLPVTGYMDGTELKDGHRPRYWSSTITNGDRKYTARNLNETNYNSYYGHRGDDRRLGMAVRAVYDNAESTITPSSIVDLGLSVKWAGYNLGATSIESPGSYYGWGETASRTVFDWETYEWAVGSNVMSKYNTTDGLTILKRDDDAAYKKLGGPYWRMPTIEEWNELQEKCEWTPCTINAQRGYRIKSKTNGKSIFLPVTGFKDGQQMKDGMRARYWSSTISNGDRKYTARNLNETNYNSYYGHKGDDRRLGMLVRAVYDDTDKQITSGNLVDLGLSVKWAGKNLGASSCDELGNYYAWGETAPKLGFDWASYKWGASADKIVKYNSTDALNTLLREDDAAYQSLGGPYWRMPTIAEWNELKENCEWTPCIINNQRGYRIKSKTNGNAIFLPFSGFLDGQQMKDGMRPRYWSSNISNGDRKYTARNLNETNYNSYYGHLGDERRLGMPIRAVYDSSMDNIVLTEGEFIDMGVSVEWARCNMGTSYPEEIGSYYAWGETSPKSSFTWESYRFGTSENLSKYNGQDDLRVLDREDDAVYRRYGGNHRMPTIGEWEELLNNCTVREVKIRNRRGHLLTSKINGNTLFIPYSGYKQETQLHDGVRPRYWSSNISNGDRKYTARNLNETNYNSYYGHKGDDRYLGMPIRGVRAKYEKEVTAGELVDLGLSVKWASCNIGAERPEDVGYYYGWGEKIDGKKEFNWETYWHTNDAASTGITKYNNADGRKYLDWEDDVVHVKKKGNWRMPTIEEWEELRNNCDWKETTLNGIRGYRITSRTNSNSIFLPIGGFMQEKQLHDGMRARYWSSSHTNGDRQYTARNLNETNYNSYYGHKGDDRDLGMPVRGIYDDYAESVLTGGELVNMGLSVRWESCNVGAKAPEETGSYFGWGEVATESSYSWANYLYGHQASSDAMTKYNAEDKLRTLEHIDDAAYLYIGNGTRMPTIGEWEELWNNTDKVMKILNGHLGLILTSKKNGNSIFLPVAGYMDEKQLRDGMRPRYWSSSLTNGDRLFTARNLNETNYNSYYGHKGDERRLGMPVRGVKE